MPDTRLILHVKGTEQETTMLPKQVVRAAISQGQITHSQLIWSPADNAWKQVRELPHLLPSQKLAPVPQPRVPTAPLPDMKATPRARVASVPLPVVKVATAKPTVAGAEKQARVPTARAVAMPQVKASAKPASESERPKAAVPAKNLVVHEAGESHPLKWVCIALGILIVTAVSVNLLLVDLPLSSRMGKTRYPSVTVYGHLGAFMQPTVMVIHVRPNPALTEANLADFLVALAHSSPSAPFSGGSYERVALTSGWTGQYSFSGNDWKQLGDMDQDDDARRKEFIVDQLGSASGEPVMPAPSTLTDDVRQATRDKIWAAFASQLVSAN